MRWFWCSWKGCKLLSAVEGSSLWTLSSMNYTYECCKNSKAQKNHPCLSIGDIPSCDSSREVDPECSNHAVWPRLALQEKCYIHDTDRPVKNYFEEKFCAPNHFHQYDMNYQGNCESGNVVNYRGRVWHRSSNSVPQHQIKGRQFFVLRVPYLQGWRFAAEGHKALSWLHTHKAQIAQLWRVFHMLRPLYLSSESMWVPALEKAEKK